MFAVATLLLTALTLALLAYDTDRAGRPTVAAVLAGGARLFAGIGVLIGVIIWVSR